MPTTARSGYPAEQPAELGLDVPDVRAVVAQERDEQGGRLGEVVRRTVAPVRSGSAKSGAGVPRGTMSEDMATRPTLAEHDVGPVFRG